MKDLLKHLGNMLEDYWLINFIYITVKKTWINLPITYNTTLKESFQYIRINMAVDRHQLKWKYLLILLAARTKSILNNLNVWIKIETNVSQILFQFIDNHLIIKHLKLQLNYELWIRKIVKISIILQTINHA